jgi:hypothetical protein
MKKKRKKFLELYPKKLRKSSKLRKIEDFLNWKFENNIDGCKDKFYRYLESHCVYRSLK